jgi:hypothetical protein
VKRGPGFVILELANSTGIHAVAHQPAFDFRPLAIRLLLPSRNPAIATDRRERRSIPIAAG